MEVKSSQYLHLTMGQGPYFDDFWPLSYLIPLFIVWKTISKKLGISRFRCCTLIILHIMFVHMDMGMTLRAQTTSIIYKETCNHQTEIDKIYPFVSISWMLIHLFALLYRLWLLEFLCVMSGTFAIAMSWDLFLEFYLLMFQMWSVILKLDYLYHAH